MVRIFFIKRSAYDTHRRRIWGRSFKMYEVGTVTDQSTDFFASDLIGMRFYNVEVGFDAT